MSNESERPINDAQPQADAEPQIPLTELIRTRLNKVRELAAKNVNSYPYKYDRTHQILKVQADFEKMVTDETVVRIAGRVMLKRKMGKSTFIDIRDGSERIQVYMKLNNIGQEAYDLVNTLDLGDIIGCEGTLFLTRTEERTLNVTSFELLCKALHPLPDKHAGLTDVETRSRRRYADLIVNPEVRDVFRMRTRIIKTIRDYLDDRGFLEVETPILQPLYGGGNALPFKTHHHRLDRELYLRIADELYLKRLVVGGFEKVWEFCKDFRNEGFDRLHNPEFSMIELYWAYADYHDIAELLEELLRHVVMELHGSHKILYGDHEIDFGPKFRWVSMIDSIKEQTDIDFGLMSFEEAKEAAKAHINDVDKLINWGKVVEAVWEKTVEPTLVQPTFITDFPKDISPLAKAHRSEERLTERFELFIAGNEMGNAFSELNDPIDQIKRFLQQGKALEAGDEEAQPLDDDFITALAYGMPPTGGLGFGVDRLIMLLTNQHNIREVLLFPQMKDLKEGSVLVSKILAQLIAEDEKE